MGVSDATTEKYIASMAQKAKSEGEILDKLLDAELPATDDTRRFARQLYERFGVQSKKAKVDDVSEYQKKEREMLEKRRKYESYALVGEESSSSDDEEENEEN